MPDNSIEMREGGQGDSGARAGGFQTTPGRAPGESTADFEREEGPSSSTGSAPSQSPLQNPMYIGGAAAAAVVLLLIIVFSMSGGGGKEGDGSTPTPVPPAEMEGFRSVVGSACKEQIYKSGPQFTHLEKFMAQFGELCSSNELNDAAIESPTGNGFLLKAKGPLKHDMLFKPLTEKQKGNFMDFWKDKDIKERSYLIPQVAIVEADGQAWGVEPSPYLDAGKKGKTYDILTPGGHGQWDSDFAGKPVKMTLEHWEKMTIRLSEDVSNLLKYSNSQYKMQVSILGTEEVTKQSSLGKHAWSVKDGKGASHGLLFGGITDYLAAPRPEEEDDEGREKDDAIRACRFFLYIATQMVTPCRCAHDHDHGDDHGPSDDCIEDFDGLFKDILGETLPEKDADKLDKVCQAVEGSSGDVSKVMSFEAGLLQHALEKLEGDTPCEGRFRRPENCVESFEYEGETRDGCVTDPYLFEDIKAPWCSWKKKVEGEADWDGPWSFCVKCTEKPDDDEPGPGPDVDEDDGETAVKALCGLEEEDDIDDLDPSMKEIMNQIRGLCAKTEGKLDVTKVPDSQRATELLVKAQDPLKTDVKLFALMDSEKERASGDGRLDVQTPVRHSLLVPLIASFNEGNLVWGVTPATQLDASAASRVGGLTNSYKIGGITSSASREGVPHWKGFQEDYPKGLGISMEHWAKLIVRLVEDMQILKEMQSISYTLEVGIHSRMPEEDTTVKNALGKHVLRAYDFSAKGEVGMLTGGVVDYLQDERLLQMGVSSSVYACEFLLFVTTEMFLPCVWPQDKDEPEDGNCVTDFTELWPKLVKSGTDVKDDNDEFLAQICQSLNDETNFLQDVGKMLEFVDIKLNEKMEHKSCTDGFRQPEHCLSKFEYDGEPINDCAKQELFPEIKAPWCSWKPKLEKEGLEWDGPWSFCTHCPDDPDTLDRRIVV